MSFPYKKSKKGVKSSDSGSDASGLTKVCKFFLRGSCSNKRCRYLHVRDVPSSTSAPSSAGSDVLITVLKLLFEKERDNIIMQDSTGVVLQLSSMANYVCLVSIQKSIDFNSKVFCDSLGRCIQEVCFPSLPRGYILDGNGIRSVLHLVNSFRYYGLADHVAALSLANNPLDSLDFVQHLKHFSNLREIVGAGSMCGEEAMSVRDAIKSNLPSVMSIDGRSARAAPMSLPWPLHYRSQFTDGSTGSAALSHDPLQANLYQFITSSVLCPLEKADMETVSDAYSLSAMLSISFCDNNSAVSSGDGSLLDRDAVRDVVALRLRQNDANHNVVLKSAKSSVVAVGRADVCAALMNLVYSNKFTVTHRIHDSVNVAVMDGHDASFCLPQPVSIVTIHGILSWTHAPATISKHGETFSIRRCFSRTFTVSTADSGRWHVVNDMLSLYPLSVGEQEVAELPNILYMPAVDRRLARRFAAQYSVPEPVVSLLVSTVSSDAHLASILVDLSHIGLSDFDSCAGLLDGDPLGGIMLCRLRAKFGVAEERGVELVRSVGLQWELLCDAVTVS